MYNIREISDKIYWVGGSDRRLALFENLFPLPNGVTYNSFVIDDEKIAILDTVDPSISDAFFANIQGLLAGRAPDYLVVHHMEPDHSAEITRLCRLYPEMKIVGNAQIFRFIGQFFEEDLSGRFYEVKEGDTLPLGRHSLTFVSAPMVHWPEVLFSFEVETGTLFAADAFGTFGAFSGGVFADEANFEADYLDEARRYYANIVGKFGPQVQAALKKAAGLDIKMICPVHGPLWRKDLGYILEKYDKWSRYEPEVAGVLIAYGSMYGHTKAAAELIAHRLAEKGVAHIHMYDVSKTHTSYLISEIFKFSHLVFAAPTYNLGLYLPMEALLHDMEALNLQNRKVALVANGTWAPQAHTLMQKHIEAMKDMTLLAEPFMIKSALKASQYGEVDALVQTIADSLNKTE